MKATILNVLRGKQPRRVNLSNGLNYVVVGVVGGNVECTFHKRRTHEITKAAKFDELDSEMQLEIYEAATAIYSTRQFRPFTKKSADRRNADVAALVKSMKTMGMDVKRVASGANSQYLVVDGKNVRPVTKSPKYENFCVSAKMMKDGSICSYLFIGDGSAWLVDANDVASMIESRRQIKGDVFSLVDGAMVAARGKEIRF